MNSRHTASTINDTQLDELYDAIERVRAMHQPTRGLGFDSDEDDTPGSYGEIAQVCGTCGKADEYGVRWPCATYRALAAPGPAATEATGPDCSRTTPNNSAEQPAGPTDLPS